MGGGKCSCIMTGAGISGWSTGGGIMTGDGKFGRTNGGGIMAGVGNSCRSTGGGIIAKALWHPFTIRANLGLNP